MKIHARDVLKSLMFLATAASTACATGLAPPADTPMAELRDPTQLTYLFGMGDKACTITTTTSTSLDLGAPEVQVKIGAFAIDTHEVTVDQYRYCVDMEVCSEPSGYNGPNGIVDYYYTLNGDPNPKYANFPVVLLTQNQAAEYCNFRGKRLPTEFEWELVAGGPAQTRADKLLYTFLPAQKGPDVKIPSGCDKSVALGACAGNNASARAVTTSSDDVVNVGGVAVYDLAGNVMEWTASDADEAKASPTAKPISATCDWDEKWTCDDCLTCLANVKKGDPPCSTCATCSCGDSPPTQLPGSPTGTMERTGCYQPVNTPVCPRYPAKDLPVDKSWTGKNAATKRIIRGGAYVTASDSGLPPSVFANCLGRSDARVVAKGPQDPPLVFVGFRCAMDLK